MYLYYLSVATFPNQFYVIFNWRVLEFRVRGLERLKQYQEAAAPGVFAWEIQHKSVGRVLTDSRLSGSSDSTNQIITGLLIQVVQKLTSKISSRTSKRNTCPTVLNGDKWGWHVDGMTSVSPSNRNVWVLGPVCTGPADEYRQWLRSWYATPRVGYPGPSLNWPSSPLVAGCGRGGGLMIVDRECHRDG